LTVIRQSFVSHSVGSAEHSGGVEDFQDTASIAERRFVKNVWKRGFRLDCVSLFGPQWRTLQMNGQQELVGW
jgi:hypothetical protein